MNTDERKESRMRLPSAGEGGTRRGLFVRAPPPDRDITFGKTFTRSSHYVVEYVVTAAGLGRGFRFAACNAINTQGKPPLSDHLSRPSDLD
ncbi:hypothetical protein GW17_00054096 [Ensete ventricosum]|nr:hypothetical protein GW17_00054096 [Ensete ventricosum]